MSDVARLLALYQALDEEAARQPTPTRDEIDAEIRELVADAWRYGVSADQFVEDCRRHTPAFWQDWFAMDAAAERIGAAPDEIAQAVYYREIARQSPDTNAESAA